MHVLTCITKVVKLSPTSASTFENLFTHSSFTVLLSLITPLISLAEVNRSFLLKICNEPLYASCLTYFHISLRGWWRPNIELKGELNINPYRYCFCM